MCDRLVTGLAKNRDIWVLEFCIPMNIIDTRHRAEHFGIENSLIREHFHLDLGSTRIQSELGCRFNNSAFYPDSGLFCSRSASRIIFLPEMLLRMIVFTWPTKPMFVVDTSYNYKIKLQKENYSFAFVLYSRNKNKCLWSIYMVSYMPGMILSLPLGCTKCENNP